MILHGSILKINISSSNVLVLERPYHLRSNKSTFSRPHLCGAEQSPINGVIHLLNSHCEPPRLKLGASSVRLGLYASSRIRQFAGDIFPSHASR